MVQWRLFDESKYKHTALYNIFQMYLTITFFLQPFHTQWFTNCLWRKNLNLLFFFVILTFWGKCNLFNSNRKNPNNKCHTFNRNTRVLGAKIKTDFYQLDWKSQRNTIHSGSIKYRTWAIITRSSFETALDYKPPILGPTRL